MKVEALANFPIDDPVVDMTQLPKARKDQTVHYWQLARQISRMSRPRRKYRPRRIQPVLNRTCHTRILNVQPVRARSQRARQPSHR